MIYILYSADYEVFLGGNYRPEREVLIDPTERLLDVCDGLAPMTIFADVCCFWRYKELGRPDFVKEAEEQMRGAVKRGHDVQAHVHPHWLATEINTDRGGSHYQCDLSRYLLGNWAPTENGELYAFILDLAKRARHYLTELLRPVESKYRCVAFRAGGYGIQPHTKTVLGALEDAGFLIDSSVVPGMKLGNSVNCVDFTNVPGDGNYRISRKHGLSGTSDTGLFEIPIAAATLTGVPLLLAKVRHFRRNLGSQRPPTRMGYFIHSTAKRKKPTRSRTFRKLSQALFTWEFFRAIELSRNSATMFHITRDYVSRHLEKEKDLFFSLSCHPKILCSKRLQALKEYHARIQEFYGASLESITFQQAARIITDRDSSPEQCPS